MSLLPTDHGAQRQRRVSFRGLQALCAEDR